MIDVNLLFSIIVIAIAVVNTVTIAAVVRELITGSYRQYAEKRVLHLEQMRRVEEELKKGRDHDRQD